MARSELVWNVGNTGGTSLRGYLDLMPGGFDATVDRLKALGAQDDGPGDKTTVEFHGTYNGAVFTLYDYYEDRSLHIGGRGGFWDGGPALDVLGLQAHLARLFALPEVIDVRQLHGDPRHWGKS